MTWRQEQNWLKSKHNISMGYSYSSIPGTYAIEIRAHSCPMPLGMLWYRWLENNTTVEILNIWVFEPVRRCGAATQMLEAIFNAQGVEKIVTDTGTVSGKAWMKANGFIKTKHNWVKTKCATPKKMAKAAKPKKAKDSGKRYV